MAEVRESERIAGVYVVELQQWPDPRGRFVETYRREWIPGAREMVQGNRSESKPGVLRGLHYHLRQADYWYAVRGRMFVALYDFRASSPTVGNVLTLEMGDGNERGVYIPPGVAHGFLALTGVTMTYLVDGYFDNTDEHGIRYDDPAVAVPWPGGIELVVSDRDRTNPAASEVAGADRPA